jgi:hypothetical protein
VREAIIANRLLRFSDSSRFHRVTRLRLLANFYFQNSLDAENTSQSGVDSKHHIQEVPAAVVQLRELGRNDLDSDRLCNCLVAADHLGAFPSLAFTQRAPGSVLMGAARTAAGDTAGALFPPGRADAPAETERVPRAYRPGWKSDVSALAPRASIACMPDGQRFGALRAGGR